MFIKFKLIKFEKCLLFQILEQNFLYNSPDISIEQRPHSVKRLYKGIDFDDSSIFSQSYPDIRNYGGKLLIYLRGNQPNKNKNIVIKICEDNEIRDKEYDLIIDSLSKLKENLE